MPRPAVDVVMPFAGTEQQLRAALERLATLEAGPGDTLTLVDNRRSGSLPSAPAGVDLIAARERASSYFARNAGARAGSAAWLLFIDADVEPAPALLDELMTPAPGERTAVLAGAVNDELPPSGARGALALRYQWLKGSMSQRTTLGHAGWPFAQTANCAVRRAAFEQAGGFREVRSGGDADLCFRLRAAGWEIEERAHAVVVHRSRASIRALLRQQARHGAGLAWLEREHPGSFPARRLPGLAAWSARRAAGALRSGAHGDGDAALVGAVDAVAVWAVELGRRLPNRERER